MCVPLLSVFRYYLCSSFCKCTILPSFWATKQITDQTTALNPTSAGAELNYLQINRYGKKESIEIIFFKEEPVAYRLNGLKHCESIKCKS